ncbi:MAG: glucose-6-phosphate isomerase, archaeal [Methanofollis sp.]|nr:glucose-6-phosphate isomerase, archaeal [Methanofollis sp.]
MVHWEGPLPEPHIRTLADMDGVLAAPEIRAEDPDRPLYFMYRDLALNEEDHSWLSARSLRYDMTVIPPGVIGPEFVKTKGHYHPANQAGIGYPEVYEVVEGTAHFLLQRRDALDVVLVKAGAGEVAVIPPGFGHVTINPGNADLVLANLVSTAFSSDYAPYAAMGGAAYYEMADGRLVRNPGYQTAAQVRTAVPRPVPAFCTAAGTPIYRLVGKESCLRFLNRPEEYPEAFAGCMGDAAERDVTSS